MKEQTIPFILRNETPGQQRKSLLVFFTIHLCTVHRSPLFHFGKYAKKIPEKQKKDQGIHATSTEGENMHKKTRTTIFSREGLSVLEVINPVSDKIGFLTMRSVKEKKI